MATTTFGDLRREAEKDGGFSPHPKGIFTMQITSADVKRGSQGQPQVLARFQTIDPGEYNGRSLLNNMSPKKNDGNANPVFFRQMAALGFGDDNALWSQVDNLDEDQAVALIASSLVGAQGMVEVDHQDFNGLRDNVKSIKLLGSVQPRVSIDPTGVPSAPVVAIPAAAAPAPVAPAPAPAAPVAAPAPAPVPVAPAPAPVAPQPVAAPVTPAPAPVAPVLPEAQPVAPAPQAAAVVPAAEATPAPVSAEQVVAQLPSPPDRPF